jgi:hypothetical protein
MTLHKHLPIYKAAYDLMVLAAQLTRNMPRDFKSSFGSKLRDECVELVLLISRANAARDKVPHLDQLIERLEVAELLIRLAHDLRFISNGQYAQAIEVTGSIGKQAGGWRKQSAIATSDTAPPHPRPAATIAGDLFG